MGTFSLERGRARREFRVGAPFGARHQGANFVEAADAAPGAERGAIQGRHGVGEFEGVAHRHCLQNSIAERPVKHVSGAGGIHAVDHEGRRVVELADSSASAPCAPRVMAATFMPYSFCIVSSAWNGSLSPVQAAGNSELATR